MRYDADVTISGAGPIGLSLASILSEYCSVVVIDQEEIPYTTKTWNTWSDIAKLLPPEVIVHHADRGLFASHLGPSVVNHDALTDTTDDEKVMNHFYGTLEENIARTKKVPFGH